MWQADHRTSDTNSPVELARRVVAPGRAERLKEIDPRVALIKAQEREVLRPQGFSFLEIDVTSTTAEKVAEGILAGLRKRQTASYSLEPTASTAALLLRHCGFGRRLKPSVCWACLGAQGCKSSLQVDEEEGGKCKDITA